MELMEVPFPALKKGSVLVRNHFSVISAGTEGKTVKDARLSYIGKAKARKDEVKKVIQAAKTHGVMKTYQMVMNKLEAPSPLGYSCAGEVIAVADDVSGFQVGDLVACGGNSANHAEVVCVPENLCAKIPENVSMEDAAFTTIAAIAMQGVRQAELSLGENCVVIGLGLVGQITVQLLKASGVKVIGVDIDPVQVEKGKELGCDVALNRDDEQIEDKILNATNGYGTDAVIITAGTSSHDPIDFSGEIARQKAKIVIVGAVPTGFKRKNYFKKELDLRMSCSYGPGRYQSEYEEKGLDYPIGYVRWTEQRNMQAFLQLLSNGSVGLSGIITHKYSFDEARKAYDIIVNKTERFSGITLKYDVEKELSTNVMSSKILSGKGVVGFIGAGSFAQNFLLPNLKDSLQFKTVVTARGNNAKNIAGKYGFSNASGSADDVFSDDNIDTVFIATRHDSHAQYVLEGLNTNKNIFVEKPLCLTPDELEQIAEVEKGSKGSVMVGFNRRFAPHVVELKNKMTGIPVAITYRINAGVVPADHWVHDPEVGGGRILGEVCHFIDLCTFIAGSPVKSVSANALSDGKSLKDTVMVSLNMQNGSVATIAYLSNGNKELPKERVEVFGGGTIAVIDDFKVMNWMGKKSSTVKLPKQDKGHANELKAYSTAVKEGEELPISFADSYHSMLITFKVLESIQNNGETLFV